MPTEDRKTCSKCGEAKPLTAYYIRDGKPIAACKACTIRQVSKYQKANAAKVNAWQRQNRNPTKDRARQRKWRYGNGREKYLAKQKRYREQHVAALAAAWAKWYEANADNVARRAAANYDPVKKRNTRNPKQVRLDRERRRARLINAYVEDTPFEAVLLRDRGICGICHQPIMDNRIDLDHIIPLAAGGTHEMKNVQIAHRACNRKKWHKVNFTLADTA